MKILFTFPGQGTQTIGMLHKLPQTKLTQQLLNKASDVLNQDVLLLDSEKALQKTRAVQLCDLIVGVVFASLFKQHDVNIDMTCGLSIGAFPAAVIAGTLSFNDALKLVSLRGTLMEHAYPSGYGMTSIQGLFQEKIEKIVNKIHSIKTPVYIANYNDEKQFVISGSDEAMSLVATLALECGAARIKRLVVSVPSHCELLNQPAQELNSEIKKVNFNQSTSRYLSASTARVILEPEKIAKDLAFNMCHSVHWHDSMVAADERGIDLIIEMPPGAVLTGLTKKAVIKSEAISACQNSISATVSLINFLKNNKF